ncbi:hypothetical protein [Nereida ignava]|uniref:hypothetical protein n=1 Tax=Nereida ignava TaxID=282199 RepID=UPI0030F90DB4
MAEEILIAAGVAVGHAVTLPGISAAKAGLALATVRPETWQRAAGGVAAGIRAAGAAAKATDARPGDAPANDAHDMLAKLNRVAAGVALPDEARATCPHPAGVAFTAGRHDRFLARVSGRWTEVLAIDPDSKTKHPRMAEPRPGRTLVRLGVNTGSTPIFVQQSPGASYEESFLFSPDSAQAAWTSPGANKRPAHLFEGARAAMHYGVHPISVTVCAVRQSSADTAATVHISMETPPPLQCPHCPRMFDFPELLYAHSSQQHERTDELAVSMHTAVRTVVAAYLASDTMRVVAAESLLCPMLTERDYGAIATIVTRKTVQKLSACLSFGARMHLFRRNVVGLRKSTAGVVKNSIFAHRRRHFTADNIAAGKRVPFVLSWHCCKTLVGSDNWIPASKAELTSWANVPDNATFGDNLFFELLNSERAIKTSMPGMLPTLFSPVTANMPGYYVAPQDNTLIVGCMLDIVEVKADTCTCNVVKYHNVGMTLRDKMPDNTTTAYTGTSIQVAKADLEHQLLGKTIAPRAGEIVLIDNDDGDGLTPHWVTNATENGEVAVQPAFQLQPTVMRATEMTRQNNWYNSRADTMPSPVVYKTGTVGNSVDTTRYFDTIAHTDPPWEDAKLTGDALKAAMAIAPGIQWICSTENIPELHAAPGDGYSVHQTVLRKPEVGDELWCNNTDVLYKVTGCVPVIARITAIDNPEGTSGDTWETRVCVHANCMASLARVVVSKHGAPDLQNMLKRVLCQARELANPERPTYGGLFVGQINNNLAREVFDRKIDHASGTEWTEQRITAAASSYLFDTVSSTIQAGHFLYDMQTESARNVFLAIVVFLLETPVISHQTLTESLWDWFHAGESRTDLRQRHTAMLETLSTAFDGFENDESRFSLVRDTLTPDNCTSVAFAGTPGYFVPDYDVYMQRIPTWRKQNHMHPLVATSKCKPHTMFPLEPAEPSLAADSAFLNSMGSYIEARFFAGDTVEWNNNENSVVAVVTSYNKENKKYALWIPGTPTQAGKTVTGIDVAQLNYSAASVAETVKANVLKALYSGQSSAAVTADGKHHTLRVGGMYKASAMNGAVATIISIEPDYSDPALPAKDVKFVIATAADGTSKAASNSTKVKAAVFCLRYPTEVLPTGFESGAMAADYTAAERERVAEAIAGRNACVWLAPIMETDEYAAAMQHDLLIVDIIGVKLAKRVADFFKTMLVAMRNLLEQSLAPLQAAYNVAIQALVSQCGTLNKWLYGALDTAAPLLGIAASLKMANIDLFDLLPFVRTATETFKRVIPIGSDLLTASKTARNLVGLGALYFVKTFMKKQVYAAWNLLATTTTAFATNALNKQLGLSNVATAEVPIVEQLKSSTWSDKLKTAASHTADRASSVFQAVLWSVGLGNESIADYFTGENVSNKLINCYNSIDKWITDLETSISESDDNQWLKLFLEPLKTFRTMLNTAGNTFLVTLLRMLKQSGVDLQLGSGATKYSAIDAIGGSVLGVKNDTLAVAHAKAVGAWGTVITLVAGDWAYALKPLLDVGLPPLLDATGISPAVLCRLLRNIPNHTSVRLRNCIRFLLIGSAMYNMSGVGSAQHYLQNYLPRALIDKVKAAVESFTKAAATLREKINQFLARCSDLIVGSSTSRPLLDSADAAYKKYDALLIQFEAAKKKEQKARITYEDASDKIANGGSLDDSNAAYEAYKNAIADTHALQSKCDAQEAACREAVAREPRLQIPGLAGLASTFMRGVRALLSTTKNYRFILDFGTHILDGSDLNVSYWSATRQGMDMNKIMDYTRSATGSGWAASLAAYAECQILDGMRRLLAAYGAPARMLLDRLGSATLVDVLNTFSAPAKAVISISMGWMLSVAIPAVTTAISVVAGAATFPVLAAAWAATGTAAVTAAAATQRKVGPALLQQLLEAREQAGPRMAAFEIVPYVPDPKHAGSGAAALFDEWCVEAPFSAAVAAAEAEASTRFFRDAFVAGSPVVRVHVANTTTTIDLNKSFAELQYALAADGTAPVAITTFGNEENVPSRSCVAGMPLRRRFGSTISVAVKTTAAATPAALQRRRGMGAAFASLCSAADTPSWANMLIKNDVIPNAWVNADIGHRTAARRRYVHGVRTTGTATPFEEQLLVLVLMLEANHIHAHATTAERATVASYTAKDVVAQKAACYALLREKKDN